MSVGSWAGKQVFSGPEENGVLVRSLFSTGNWPLNQLLSLPDLKIWQNASYTRFEG